MRLVKAQVTDFRRIKDSTEFEVGVVTCLVGMGPQLLVSVT